MHRELKVVLVSLIGMLAAGSFTIFGQQKQPRPDSEDVVIERTQVFQGQVGPGVPPPPGDTFVFVSSEMNFDGQTVKGAPYSAQAVTESTQTLSDGNRIINKSTAAVYRDSEGRTRREQTLRAFGPFAAGGDGPQMIFISDPVSGVSYSLDPRIHVARKMPAFRFEFKTGPEKRPAPAVQGGAVIFERSAVGGPPQGPPPPMAEGPGDRMFTLRAPAAPGSADFVYKQEPGREKNAVTEKLGTQVIEGVSAEGSRTTVTIPAGEIGNERAIEIVSERWFSPDLKTVVMTKHSDPRFGETVYRLTNISRDEPARTLFEVPADYTIKDDSGPMRMKKPAPPTP